MLCVGAGERPWIELDRINGSPGREHDASRTNQGANPDDTGSEGLGMTRHPPPFRSWVLEQRLHRARLEQRSLTTEISIRQQPARVRPVPEFANKPHAARLSHLRRGGERPFLERPRRSIWPSAHLTTILG